MLPPVNVVGNEPTASSEKSSVQVGFGISVPPCAA